MRLFLDLIKELNLKLTKADLTTALGKKADQQSLTTLQATVSSKADKKDLTTLQATVEGKANKKDLNGKADKSALETLKTTVAGKADQQSLTTLQATVEGKADKEDLTTLQATVSGKADKKDLDAKANVADIIPKSDLETMLDAKANRSELEEGGSKEYIDTELEKKANKSELKEIRDQIEILLKDYKRLSKSIYIEADLPATVGPWSGLNLQTGFQFKNLKIKHNIDNLAISNAKVFNFTAPQEENYLIDASITIKFMKEASGVGLPTFIYKIQVFRENKWHNSKIMQWQYNGVTNKANKAAKPTFSLATLKSTDIIHLKKDEKIQFALDCKSLLVDSKEIYIVVPTSFVICSLN